MNLFSFYPSKPTLSGRRRYRLHSRFGVSLLVLQLEVNYHKYSQEHKKYVIDYIGWRDARIQDLTVGDFCEQEATDNPQD